MEGFKNIVSAGVAVGFSPVVISEVLGSYLAAFGQERIAQATVGFCVDLMFQATVKYWFSPEGQEVTVMESIQGLDYVQASASAVEGLISTQGWQGLVTSVVISCAVDGFSREGAFHEFSLGQCLQGAGSAVLVGGALELFAIRNKFGGIARSRLASGISRLVEATGSRVGKGWDMYRYLRPGAISAADVAALFDIDEALAGMAATRIQQSSVLQSLFREGDWWMSVRKMASSAENRAQLLNDLTGNVNLAQAFKERPELVGAWDLMRQAGTNLRLNTAILGKIDFLKSKNLTDAQLIKIGQLDDIKAVDIAESLAKRTNPSVPINQLDLIPANAKILESVRPSIMDEVRSIASNTNLRNPDALHRFLDNAKLNPSQSGWKYELDVANESLGSGSSIEFSKNVPHSSGTGTKEVDILDYTANRIVEIKSYSSVNWTAIARNLGDDVGVQIGNIDNALKSQFSEHIGRVKIESSGHQSWYNASREELIQYIQTAVTNPNWGAGVKANMDNMTHLIIENSTGIHTIEKALWQ